MAKTRIKKPDCVLEEHLEYLDMLRASNSINMLGAKDPLMDEFPDLSREDAKAILLYWMRNYGR